MYWVQGKTRKANPVKKSLEDSKPATGLRLNPVHSTDMEDRVNRNEKEQRKGL